MKNKIILLFLFVSFVSSLTAQDITGIVLNAPDNIIFGLSAEEKDKLVAQPKDSAIVSVNNIFQKTTKRLNLSDDYISLQTSEAGTTQIKLLPLVNESKIICVVTTVCGKVCDSKIQFFYSANWTPLENVELFPRLDINTFLEDNIDKNSDDFQNALAVVSMLPVKLVLDADTQDIKAELGIKEYLSETEYNEIEKYLKKDPVTFKWNKISFK
ncbi:DUF3256 family protein [Dysgonomonas sp. 520]|uniref:DUF3256 family protein n=1 Tax=Dysgonomonas sp. 520 TaxID=2302931 RepID=UPI0013D3DBAF|nr:DUF3256 family protein [Dysgonomonas sp. 520]NDW10228.1 DUF3256 family protein [Dysgonomonas sp. 520]